MFSTLLWGRFWVKQTREGHWLHRTDFDLISLPRWPASCGFFLSFCFLLSSSIDTECSFLLYFTAVIYSLTKNYFFGISINWNWYYLQKGNEVETKKQATREEVETKVIWNWQFFAGFLIRRNNSQLPPVHEDLISASASHAYIEWIFFCIILLYICLQKWTDYKHLRRVCFSLWSLFMYCWLHNTGGCLQCWHWLCMKFETEVETEVKFI